MAKMLGGFPISFIGEMNKKLFKPFTILQFFKVVEGMVGQGKRA